jgi:hypothetical protein
LKSHAQPKDDKSDQFFTEQISMDLLKANQPSMIKQENVMAHEADPNLSSKIDSLKQQNDHLFTFVLIGCIIAGVIALSAAGVCWYTVHKSYKTSEAEYGVKIGKFNSKGSVKSTSSSSGDRRLAQSAQMYHYQHQKQQMIAMEKANNDTKPDNSDNSDGEAEEGDYTVYECPGLAPTGEMVVKNPLFKEEFSQSMNNINSTAAAGASVVAATSPPPPAYSSLSPVGEPLIELDSTSSTPTATPLGELPATVESINEVNNDLNSNNTNSSAQKQ